MGCCEGTLYGRYISNVTKVKEKGKGKGGGVPWQTTFNVHKKVAQFDPKFPKASPLMHSISFYSLGSVKYLIKHI